MKIRVGYCGVYEMKLEKKVQKGLHNK